VARGTYLEHALGGDVPASLDTPAAGTLVTFDQRLAEPARLEGFRAVGVD
jgi:hypothetical protein